MMKIDKSNLEKSELILDAKEKFAKFLKSEKEKIQKITLGETGFGIETIEGYKYQLGRFNELEAIQDMWNGLFEGGKIPEDFQ